ncbi:hypothetical protein OQA88_8686 [Cercophora sp. LCS_1]
MQLLTFFLVAALQLIAPALADFYVYEGRFFRPGDGSRVVWAFHPHYPECSEVHWHTTLYRGRGDVSGDKTGVACDGMGCSDSSPDPQTIERLEMNTEFGHYTFYKFRDYKLVDLNDRVVGDCTPTAVDENTYDSIVPPVDDYSNNLRSLEIEMKLLPLLALAASQLAVPAAADFYVYQGLEQYTDLWYTVYLFNKWLFKSCDDVRASKVYLEADDVSNWNAVACDGDGCGYSNPDPEKIDRLEIHADWGHYTWYKARDGHLVDLEDKVVGNCTPISVKYHTFHCNTAFQAIDGSTRFHCKTDVGP